jgi:glucokinase
MKIAAGVDIGGTNTAIGIITENGEIPFQTSLLTTLYKEPEELVIKIAKIIKEEISKFNCQYNFLGTGIGAPNGNYFTGNIEYAPNLKWKGIIPLAQLFQKHTGANAILNNDANAAAIGEMVFGNAKGINDFLFITLGTGLGSGIVSNGKVIYGNDGFAGELGHTIIFKDGRACNCKRFGCLETYCSATGLRRTYAEIIKEDFSKKTLSSESIFIKAISGDNAAKEAFGITAEILGFALANSVAYTSPKAIFLFGGLANAGEFLLNPVKEHFEKNLLNIYKNKIPVLLSGLKEADAALLGASSPIFNN